MKIYVTYTFLNKQDRDAFYQSIKDNHIQELSLSDEGCLKYSYTPIDDTVLFLKEEWISEELQLKHLKQPHMDILKRLKNQYACQTTVRHGTTSLETERLILREFKIEDAFKIPLQKSLKRSNTENQSIILDKPLSNNAGFTLLKIAIIAIPATPTPVVIFTFFVSS